MKYEKIYLHSPIFFQNLMATAYGFKEKVSRYGGKYREYLKELDEIHHLSKPQLEKLQFDELMRLLQFAKQKSRFYAKLYQGIDLETFTGVEDLKKLPILTKEMIRTHISDIVTIPKEDSVIRSTGGTTGKSLEVYFTKEDIQKRMAILDYFKSRHGFYNLSMKRATFSGKHLIPQEQKEKNFWRYNYAMKQMLYSVFHLTEENIPYYIKSLNAFRPAVLDGYISSIYDLANYMERNKVRLDFELMAIFPTAEPVNEEQRSAIERVFHCKVYDQYASSEGAPFIYECEDGKLHYDISTGIIENKEDSNEILVTSFTRYGTPLIRYAIGDSVEFDKSGSTCTCSNPMPIVNKIEGRTGDYLFSHNGSKVNEVAVSFNANPQGVIRYQLIQEAAHSIHVKLVVDDTFRYQDVKVLEEEVKYKLGEEMFVYVEVVDEIPREKSGKYRLIVNNVMK